MKYLTCGRNFELTEVIVWADEQSEEHYHSQKKKTLEQDTIRWEYNAQLTRI